MMFLLLSQARVPRAGSLPTNLSSSIIEIRLHLKDVAHLIPSPDFVL